MTHLGFWKSHLAQNYALREQIRRTVNSMMANIAEGHSRRSDREFVHFLFIAKSSAAELQSHLYSAHDRGYVDQAHFRELFEQADGYARMVSGLITFLTRSGKEK